jgi:hypothetical protein
MPRPVAALVLLALVSAGCVEVPGGVGDGVGGGELDGPRSAFLTSDLGLLHEAPPEGAVATGGFYRKWAAGEDYATWTGAPVEGDVLVESLVVTLVVRATGPVVESVRFPDLMVYGGAGGSFMGYGEVRDETLLLPGAPYAFAIEVGLPDGGLWIPAGEALGIKVVPVMLQEDASDIEVLVGPAGSVAAWTQRALDASPRPAVSGATSGEVVGSAYAGDAAPGSVSLRTPVQVPEGAGAFLAWMNTTSNEGIPDVDLSLLDPAGETIAFSGTPTPRESLKLHAGNLRGPGEYTLVVTSYGSARAAFELTWAIG